MSPFNIVVENKGNFLNKWQELRKSDNVLVQYKAKQFMGILTDAGVIEEFDVELYFAMVEKITVYDGGRLIVSLLDGMAVECEIYAIISLS